MYVCVYVCVLARAFVCVCVCVCVCINVQFLAQCFFLHVQLYVWVATYVSKSLLHLCVWMCVYVIYVETIKENMCCVRCACV